MQYIKDTAAESGVDTRIHFKHRVTAADWSTAESRWYVTAERTDTNETIRLTAGFLFACSGYYRYDHGYLPAFKGMEDFAGTIVHPQAWPENLDLAGKRIVVVGSGATAVTLVPALARSAAHVTMLQRSPSYIASLPEKSPVVAVLRKVLPAQKAGTAAKWFHAMVTQGFYRVSRRYPKVVRALLLKSLKRQLPPGYDIASHFMPRYNPWDQRFCAVPDGDLFKSIRAGTASVVTDHIDRFTERGLLLVSGTELEADIIVTATGLELLFLGGIALSVDGEAGRPGDPAHLQGDDARGRAEPGGRRRVHQRLLDAQVRPDLRLRLPPPEPHARPRVDRGACRGTGTRPWARGRSSGSRRATSNARSISSPSRDRRTRGRSTTATCATTAH